MPDAMAGRTSRFAAAILSASFYTDRLHRPRRRESRRALRSSASPEFHGSPARHCDTLASPPSECRHVILLPHRGAAEIVPGHAMDRVRRTNPAVQPTRLRRACSGTYPLLSFSAAYYLPPLGLAQTVPWGTRSAARHGNGLRRQSERGLGFLLEIQVEGRRCRTVIKIILVLQRRIDQDR